MKNEMRKRTANKVLKLKEGYEYGREGGHQRYRLSELVPCKVLDELLSSPPTRSLTGFEECQDFVSREGVVATKEDGHSIDLERYVTDAGYASMNQFASRMREYGERKRFVRNRCLHYQTGWRRQQSGARG